MLRRITRQTRLPSDPPPDGAVDVTRRAQMVHHAPMRSNDAIVVI
jgi:hypothetical protein